MGGGGGGGESRGEQARTMMGGVTAGSSGGLARLPIPGNAEFVYVLALSVLLAIIAAIADSFDTRGWVTSVTAISVAYLLSRGIAKASRVLEQ